MTPIGSRHAACVDRLGQLFHNALAHEVIVRTFQSPTDAHPLAEDVLLVVEVADPSLGMDTAVKIPMYARAGIPEAWVVNLVDDCIEVYREPAGEAYKATERVFGEGQVTSKSFPRLNITPKNVLF